MGPASVAVVGLKRAFGLGHGAQTLRSGQGFSGVEPFLSTEAPFRPEEALIPSASLRKARYAQRWRSCGKDIDLGQDSGAPENARGRARVRLLVPGFTADCL